MGSNNETAQATGIRGWIEKIRTHPISVVLIFIAALIGSVASFFKDTNTIFSVLTNEKQASESVQPGSGNVAQKDPSLPPPPEAPTGPQNEPAEKRANTVTPAPEQVLASATNQMLLTCSPYAELARKNGTPENQIATAIRTPKILGDSLRDAAANGKISCIKALLEAGAPPNGDNDITEQGTRDMTPLIAAIWEGNMQIVRMLLDGGANPDFKGMRLPQPEAVGLPPIVAAKSSPDIVKLLIERGANVKAAGPQGLTALHSAAAEGDLPLTKILVEKGADLNAKYEIIGVPPLTPLDWAKQNKHTAVVQFLSKKS